MKGIRGDEEVDDFRIDLGVDDRCVVRIYGEATSALWRADG